MLSANIHLSTANRKSRRGSTNGISDVTDKRKGKKVYFFLTAPAFFLVVPRQQNPTS